MNPQLNDALNQLGAIRAVTFDLFSTLLQITQPTRPYTLLRQMIESNRRAAGNAGELADDVDAGAITPNPLTTTWASTFARTVLIEPLTWTQAAKRFAAKLTANEVARLDRELLAEIESIRLFDDVTDMLIVLQERGYQIAVCSNLASPYAAAARKLLPKVFSAEVMSCEVGFIKPEAAIYQCVLAGFDHIKDTGADRPPRPIRTDEALFVGDKYLEDVHGPRSIGMYAMQIVR